jgi:ABC-2 type transport system ATP-binding protein
MSRKAMAPAVKLRSAVALAGRFPALSGVDLTLEPGEVVSLVGPNGAGKTSVLRACAGLLPVTSGTIEVLGHDLRDDPAAARRQLGFLGHAVPLYDELTTTENLRFAVRAAGSPTDRVDAAMERLGLVGRLRRTVVGRLSAGQRRRVALAILVARKPPLWLLDEPHGSLDAEGRRVLDALVGEAADGGAAVILASHELEVAVPMVDRVVSMAGGRVMDERPGGRGRTLRAVDDPGPSDAPMGRGHVA